jgi:hypothetical protein
MCTMLKSKSLMVRGQHRRPSTRLACDRPIRAVAVREHMIGPAARDGGAPDVRRAIRHRRHRALVASGACGPRSTSTRRSDGMPLIGLMRRCRAT